jgi:Aspartyl protease
MKIPYSALPGFDNFPPQPLVPIELKHNNVETMTLALVDSGASGAGISTSLAEDLGIDWRKIPKDKGVGVGGAFVYHPIRLRINLLENEFVILAHVIEGLAPFDAILGQRDLFQRAKITFEAYNSEFGLDFRKIN